MWFKVLETIEYLRNRGLRVDGLGWQAHLRGKGLNKEDLDLIFKVADFATESALRKQNGVVGWDEENNNKLSCIDFSRIKGGKPFDISQKWYKEMINQIHSI